MMRVFQNRVLRRIFGEQTDEVTVEGRKLHNAELTKLYSPPNIKGDKTAKEMGGTFRAYGGEQQSIQGFGGET
jgi:hypothetical protein